MFQCDPSTSCLLKTLPIFHQLLHQKNPIDLHLPQLSSSVSLFWTLLLFFFSLLATSIISDTHPFDHFSSRVQTSQSRNPSSSFSQYFRHEILVGFWWFYRTWGEIEYILTVFKSLDITRWISERSSLHEWVESSQNMMR